MLAARLTGRTFPTGALAGVGGLVASIFRSILAGTGFASVFGSINVGFGCLASGLGRVGIEATGDPLVVYHDEIDEEREADFEACVTIPAEMPEDSEAYSRELEGGTVAATVHRGPYQDIRPASDTLNRRIFERGHEIAGPPRKIYLNDPRTVQPADLLTGVDFPIRPTSGCSCFREVAFGQQPTMQEPFGALPE